MTLLIAVADPRADEELVTSARNLAKAAGWVPRAVHVREAGGAVPAVRRNMARTRSAWPSAPPIATAGKRPNAPSTAKRLPRFTRPSWRRTARLVG